MNETPNTVHTTCWWRNGARRVSQTVQALLLLAAVGAAVWFYLLHRMDHEIRVLIEQRLEEHYAGLKVRVASARRIEGSGIEVRGLQILLPRAGEEPEELFYVDEMFVSCSTALPDLLDPEITHIALRRPRVTIEPRPGGNWNVARLWPLPPCKGRYPSFSVEDGLIRLAAAEALDTRPPLVELRGVTAKFTPVFHEGDLPESPSCIEMELSLASDRFHRGRAHAVFGPGAAWQMSGDAEGCALTPDVLRVLRPLLPVEMQDPRWDTLCQSFQAMVDAEFQLQQASGSAAPTWSVAGKLYEGSLAGPSIPFPVSELSCEFGIGPEQWNIDRLTARSGSATLALACQSLGAGAERQTLLQAEARRLPLDRQWTALLPENIASLWDRFLPSGEIDLRLTARGKGDEWHPEFVMECLNVSFEYAEFPYRFTGGSGAIRLQDGVLDIRRLRALAGGTVVNFEGAIQNPWSEPNGWVEIASEGAVAIDEKLLTALDAPTQAIVRSFSPRGMLGVAVRLETSDSYADGIYRRYRLDLIDGTLSYQHFPYRFDGVQGQIERDGDRIVFRNFQGTNDSGFISCQGEWKPDAEGGELLLDFVANDVPLDDELRLALQPAAQELWLSLRPRGSIDRIAVNLRYRPRQQVFSVDVQGQKWPPRQNVPGRSITLIPTWLPYRIDSVTGTVRYRDGVIELTGIRGEHGRVRLAVDGRGETHADGRWALALTHATADQLALDYDLVTALPASLRQAVTRLKLTGPLNLRGGAPPLAEPAQPNGEIPLRGPAIEILGGGELKDQVVLRWDVDLDIDNGALECGLPLANLRGGLRLQGESAPWGIACHGDLNLESLTMGQLYLTRIKGPLWTDGRALILGSGAELPPNQATNEPRALPVAADLFGGRLALDARISFAEDAAFSLQAGLTDARLENAALELAAPQEQKLSGTLSGTLGLSGTTMGTHTFTGGGMIRLRDADIYELPLMVSLLKLLSIRRPDKTAFTQSDIDYRVQGEHIYFDRINFKGDAISLRGVGEANLQRDVNMNFYTVMGRDRRQIPLLYPLLGAASRQLLMIRVTGSLDAPELDRVALPGLNERIHQIFPEEGRTARRQNEPE